MSGFGRIASTAIAENSLVVFTGPGSYTLDDGVCRVIVKKTISSPTTVYMNLDPVQGCEYVITDGKGDALIHQITVNGNGRLINGIATKTILTNRGSVTLFYDGSEFYVIGERP